jgi:hypothetical protein
MSITVDATNIRTFHQRQLDRSTYILLAAGTVVVLARDGGEKIHIANLEEKSKKHEWGIRKGDYLYSPWHGSSITQSKGISYLVEKGLGQLSVHPTRLHGGKGTGDGQGGKENSETLHC